jgi:hypothetical protein
MKVKGRHQHGEKHWKSKLTSSQVLEIRRRYSRGKGSELACEYGVSKSLISLIMNRKIWAEV